MQSVALIDYGSGNLRSAEKALQKAAADRIIHQHADDDHDDCIIALVSLVASRRWVEVANRQCYLSICDMPN